MNKIFISYSHQDEQWKDLLQSHLSVIEKQSKLRIWDDRQIATGDNWLHEIEKALTTSESAILLISRHFLTSDFILSKEIPRLLQRREKEGLRIIPLIISPCAWQTVDWLAAIQGYPADNIPLSGRDEHEVDHLLAALGQQLYKQVGSAENLENIEKTEETEKTENTENKTGLQQPQPQSTPHLSAPDTPLDKPIAQKSATNPTVKAAWIGVIGMLIAAIIATAVTLYKPDPSKAKSAEISEKRNEESNSTAAKPQPQNITVQASGSSTALIATGNATIKHQQAPDINKKPRAKEKIEALKKKPRAKEKIESLKKKPPSHRKSESRKQVSRKREPRKPEQPR